MTSPRERAAAFAPDTSSQSYADLVEECRRASKRPRNKGVKMSKRKTRWGSLVAGPPDTKPIRQSLMGLRELAIQTFEDAEQYQAVKNRIDSTSAADPKRFPAIKEG